MEFAESCMHIVSVAIKKSTRKFAESFSGGLLWRWFPECGPFGRRCRSWGRPPFRWPLAPVPHNGRPIPGWPSALARRSDVCRGRGRPRPRPTCRRPRNGRTRDNGRRGDRPSPWRGRSRTTRTGVRASKPYCRPTGPAGDRGRRSGPVLRDKPWSRNRGRGPRPASPDPRDRGARTSLDLWPVQNSCAGLWSTVGLGRGL